MKKFLLWLIGGKLVRRRPTPRNIQARPAACPICFGQGWWLSYGVDMAQERILLKQCRPCVACGGTAVLPASIVRGRTRDQAITILARKVCADHEARGNQN